MYPSDNSNDDSNTQIRLIGEPDEQLDRLTFAANVLSITLDGPYPIYREGFDWTTVAADSRAAGFCDKEITAFAKGKTVAKGRVTDVRPLPRRDGLRVDVIADPYLTE